MSSLFKFIMVAGACVTVLVSSNLLANAIENQTPPSYSGAGRWTIQQTLADGWLLLDTETGKLCVVPNASNPDQSVPCTNAPQRS